MTDFGFGPGGSTKVTVPRLMIAGADKGAGASTVMLGLVVALKRSGVPLAVGRIGPSLIEATHYRRISGRLSHSLDSWMLNKLQLVNSFARISGGADLVLLEGDKPLFDNQDDDFFFSSESELARALKLPIILVADARGKRETFAVGLKGFLDFDPRLKIEGIIANRVESPQHNAIIKESVESLLKTRYFGGFPEDTSGVFTAENTGGNLSLLSRSRLIALGNAVNEHLDLNAIQEVAKTKEILEVPSSVMGGSSRIARIAVAEDQAFHLTLQDNLDLIRRAGGDLIAFSPMVDSALPPRVAGIYLPGGYVHLYAADLNANLPMMQAIAAFAKAGGVIYAEGSALAYLSRKVLLNSGETYSMVGVMPAIASSIVEESTYAVPEYCEVTALVDNPLAEAGAVCRGLRDTRWSYRLDQEVATALEVRGRNSMVQEGESAFGIPEGFQPLPSILGTSAQLHFGSNTQLAMRFVQKVTQSPLSAVSS